MQVIKSIKETKQARRNLKGSMGFVPTMGYLHEGHLELVRRAKAENDNVAVSIFVNPSQFGPHEDLVSYPRNLQRDLSMLEKSKVDLVFTPEPRGMYPEGFNTWINVEEITSTLEGPARPGHFRGVATIVAKLFNVIEPTRAYFGQKDAQQLAVIQKMVTDLDINVEIVPVPTFREPDGLAMSSRNTYLSPEDRKAASILFKSLKLAQKLHNKGETSAEVIRNEMTALIQSESRAVIDYVSIANITTLKELEIIDGPALVSLAVKIGKTRLIDNITL